MIQKQLGCPVCFFQHCIIQSTIDSFNPNQGGLFGRSIEWGGGGFRPLGFDASWVHIWCPNQSKRFSNESWHLFEHMESLKITLCCIFLLQWIDKITMSDYGNFLAFEAKIFENSHFFTYIGNMYIKWKLESFYIQIWHKKIELVIKIFS